MPCPTMAARAPDKSWPPRAVMEGRVGSHPPCHLGCREDHCRIALPRVGSASLAWPCHGAGSNGSLPWPGTPFRLQECFRNGPLFGLVFVPEAVRLFGFSQAFLLLQGGKWDLGDHASLVWREGYPSPSWHRREGLGKLVPSWGPILLMGKERVWCLWCLRSPLNTKALRGLLPGARD